MELIKNLVRLNVLLLRYVSCSVYQYYVTLASFQNQTYLFVNN
jgi:hypothetical protein